MTADEKLERYEDLRDRDVRSPAEDAEYAALMAELLERERLNLAAHNERMRRENDELEEYGHRLEAVLARQEAYRLKVQRTIRELDSERAAIATELATVRAAAPAAAAG